jgi:hypothetical protein
MDSIEFVNQTSPENESSLTRRRFCNRLLLTSTGLALAAQTIVAKTTGSQDSMVAFPPLKIEGAEKLMPGSSLYFDYPTRNDASTGDVVYGPPQRPLDQIVLQVRAGGYVWAIGRAARATGEMIARAV